MLPFYREQLPGLRFLHVVRDGRDMAFAGNLNQLQKHSEALLGPAKPGDGQPERLIALWSRINLMAADYAQQQMAGRYLLVRFEDLCAEPVRLVRRVLDFRGFEGDAEAIAGLEVAPPATIGRWTVQDQATIRALERIAGPALRRFGYWPAEERP